MQKYTDIYIVVKWSEGAYDALIVGFTLYASKELEKSFRMM